MDKVVHFEIPTDDMARAQKFYADLFGWKITEVPGRDYHLLFTVETDPKGLPKQPGVINGGMKKREEPGEGPVVVIKVVSIEESLKKITAAGGKTVLSTQPVGDFGLYARFTDSEGNVVGLWQDVK